MDLLKRSAAPITDAAWSEIDETASTAISSILSARRALKVQGPKGIEFTAVNEGRLENLQGDMKKQEVCTGTYQLQPLTEARISFELSKWELDNIERGVKDADLSPLEDAAKKLALFEEESLYNGYKKGNIKGLCEVAGHKMKLGKDAQSILTSIGEAKYTLMESFGEMPFDLIVSADVYQKINVVFEGTNLYNLIGQIIGGQIIRSKVVKGALLIPHFDEDLEFTVGQDFAVGYESDNGESVRLFLTESFTLRILDEEKIVALS